MSYLCYYPKIKPSYLYYYKRKFFDCINFRLNRTEDATQIIIKYLIQYYTIVEFKNVYINFGYEKVHDKRYCAFI